MTTDVHAEHVGSLLRPSWLLEGRAARQRGEIDDQALADIEDRAALEAIKVQQDAGMPVFTDGEVRRATWMAGMMESIGGVVITIGAGAAKAMAARGSSPVPAREPLAQAIHPALGAPAPSVST